MDRHSNPDNEVIILEPLSELPIGLGMALLQNQEAARFFDGCTAEQRQAIVEQTHSIQSKQDMKAFVDNLSHNAL